MAIKKVDSDFPIQTVARTAIGALIGLLGGPAALRWVTEIRVVFPVAIPLIRNASMVQMGGIFWNPDR